MARAYSRDLRDQVIDSGTSARAAAERLGSGVATATVWVRRAREGERRARPQGQPRRSKLDPHRNYVPGLIAAEPDLTIAEMQERLRSEAGVSASVGTIWTFLDRAA
jgi:transposase